MPIESLAISLFIFLLRVTNNVIGTVRIIVVSRGRRGWGFGLASLESLLFAYTAGHVITDLENLPKLAAYVLGFAVGGLVGVQVENRFVKAYECVTTITSRETAHKMALALRKAGHGVTEIMGEGAHGAVEELRIIVHRRDLPQVIRIIHAIKEDAFVTVEHSEFIRGGWIRAHRK
ncbi:MAG: DUF5698 domain-containing protein [Chloroflexi bacterium]|nr:DUF5698 domain-containing protein [Chloroflexota bacterium]MCY3583232.1 DUF5698 domain-containing protein [Chloroflexota bacterium]MCY3717332.1 DUF5698 domain-containing protein [Chloroflexota bacterium]MDE2651286.1 DUF5698 domain-containing protein [Chloroflexota bacterium]MXV92795.1 DUF2179 domain-containing protein [Chloroflexota bacterium]